MPALTDDDYEQALVDDMGWRRLELVHLKKLLDEAAKRNAHGPAARGLSRAMVAICYAHWEGYSKNALEGYARLVTRRKPLLSEARDGLVLEHISRLIKRMISGDEAARSSLTDAVRGVSNDRINLEKSVLSDTKSNLRYEVLAGLFNRGNIPLDVFEVKANMIDVRLCDRRNSVAHGRALFVDAADSLDLCDEVVQLMEDMRDVMITHVRSKGYLHSTATSPGA